ncbi:MAG: aspartyl-phosphate phosphatase Spo0E family protein [Carboxydocellales bacterium]
MSTLKIEQAKRTLEAIAEKHGFNFQHPEVLAYSRKVDKLINVEQRRRLDVTKGGGLIARKWVHFFILLGIMFFLAGRLLTLNQASAGQPIKYETYIVGQENHSIWDIARKKYPGQHIGSRVREI